MNASAPALTREVEVQSKIRKVRTFSRTARVACAAVFGFGLVGAGMMLVVGMLGLPVHSPGDTTPFTPEQKAWALPIMAVGMGFWLAIAFQLYRLFGSLATGTIYTAENVSRVRHVGQLSLALAALGVALPMLSGVLGAVGFTVPVHASLSFSWQQSLSSFVSAYVILLASWIMDVGLYEKDHADELQRDAELVI